MFNKTSGISFILSGLVITAALCTLIFYKDIAPILYTYVFITSSVLIIFIVFRKPEKGVTSDVENSIQAQTIFNRKIDTETEAQPLDCSESFMTEINKLKKEPGEQFHEKLLSLIARKFEAVQGLLFLYNATEKLFKPAAYYAFYFEQDPDPFALGDGLHGQAARSREMILLENIPFERTVSSGLGKSDPLCVMILPISSDEGESRAVLELSFLSTPSEEDLSHLKQLPVCISFLFNTIVTTQ